MTRRIVAVLGGVVASLLIASTAMAFECTNASTPATSGAQIVFAADFQTVLFISPGLQQRLDRGIVDLATGEGFHGILAFDTDGDNVADASIYFGVGPDGEIPLDAQFRGPACRGLTNIGILLTQCL